MLFMFSTTSWPNAVIKLEYYDAVQCKYYHRTIDPSKLTWVNMHSYQSECNQLCMKFTMLLDSVVVYIVSNHWVTVAYVSITFNRWLLLWKLIDRRNSIYVCTRNLQTLNLQISSHVTVSHNEWEILEPHSWCNYNRKHVAMTITCVHIVIRIVRICMCQIYSLYNKYNCPSYPIPIHICQYMDIAIYSYYWMHICIYTHIKYLNYHWAVIQCRSYFPLNCVEYLVSWKTAWNTIAYQCICCYSDEKVQTSLIVKWIRDYIL